MPELEDTTEDKKTERIAFELPPILAEKLRRLAAERFTNVSAYLRQLIDNAR